VHCIFAYSSKRRSQYHWLNIIYKHLKFKKKKKLYIIIPMKGDVVNIIRCIETLKNSLAEMF